MSDLPTDPTSTGDAFSDLLERMKVSSLDLDDLLADQEDAYVNGYDFRALSTNGAADNHRFLGSFLKPTMDTFQQYIDKVLEESYRLVGQGRNSNILQNFMSRLDRHGTALVPPNTMNYGFTFITRPRLNLTEGNLRQSAYFAGLETHDSSAVPFMIRGLLDTVLSTNVAPTLGTSQFVELQEFSTKAASSPLLDIRNPFLVPLCNGLKGMSGWPDFTLESETTEGDFHSGDFTFIQGSDMLNKSTELSLEFRDIQGGIVVAIIYYWLLYIAYQAKGIMMAYPDDIYEQRLNYTVSIYRFITDPTRKYVIWWAKATGCFPKSIPVGALFNINQGEVTITSATNFSVPFVANKIEYNHPGILMDFNALMKRYNPDLDMTKLNNGSSSMIEIPYYRDGQMSYDVRRMNFMGVPYLVTNSRGIELKWFTDSTYCDDTDEYNEIKQIAQANKTDSSGKLVTSNNSTTSATELREKEFNELYNQVVSTRDQQIASLQSMFNQATQSANNTTNTNNDASAV